jgi:hypothetical protein
MSIFTIRKGLSICRAARAEGNLPELTASLTRQYARYKGVQLRAFEPSPDARVLLPRVDLIRKQEVQDCFGKSGLALRQEEIGSIITNLHDRYPSARQPSGTIVFDELGPTVDHRGIRCLTLIPDLESRRTLNRERQILWAYLGAITGRKLSELPNSHYNFAMRIAAFTEETREGVPQRVLESAITHLCIETKLEGIHCHPDPLAMTEPSLQLSDTAEHLTSRRHECDLVACVKAKNLVA